MTQFRQSVVSRAAARTRPAGLLQGGCFILAVAFMVAMVLGLIA